MHVTSSHFTSHSSTSLHSTSVHSTLFHFTWLYVVFNSLFFTSFHFDSIRFTLLHFPFLYFTSFHFTSIHSTLHYFTSPHMAISTLNITLHYSSHLFSILPYPSISFFPSLFPSLLSLHFPSFHSITPHVRDFNSFRCLHFFSFQFKPASSLGDLLLLILYPTLTLTILPILLPLLGFPSFVASSTADWYFSNLCSSASSTVFGAGGGPVAWESPLEDWLVDGDGDGVLGSDDACCCVVDVANFGFATRPPTRHGVIDLV